MEGPVELRSEFDARRSGRRVAAPRPLPLRAHRQMTPPVVSPPLQQHSQMELQVCTCQALAPPHYF